MAFDIKKLNKSTFKGVRFYTKSSNRSGGKRLTEHEYINGGTNTEENGLVNNTFKITAFFGGENYLEEKENFINALQSEGSGILVDMFHGTKEVFCSSWSCDEKVTEYGKCTFSLEFKLKTNNLEEQTLIIYNEDISNEAFNLLRDSYNPNLGEEIMNEVAIAINKVFDFVDDSIKFLEDSRDLIQGIKSKIGAIKTKMVSSVLRVESLIDDIVSISSSFSDILSFDSFSSTDQNSLANAHRKILEDSLLGTFDNSIDEVANENTKAFTIALVTVLIQTDIKNLENVTYSTGDNFGTFKDDILSTMQLLENEIQSNTTDEIEIGESRQEILKAYQTSKISFVKYYTQRYSGLQNLEDENIVSTIDIVSLTIDKYVDINRIDEVLTNNGILDPFFINGNIKVLKR